MNNNLPLFENATITLKQTGRRWRAIVYVNMVRHETRGYLDKEEARTEGIAQAVSKGALVLQREFV